jgi:hypothetical protein
LNHKNINQLINEAMAIEEQDAKEAGALGYMCRSLKPSPTHIQQIPVR